MAITGSWGTQIALHLFAPETQPSPPNQNPSVGVPQINYLIATIVNSSDVPVQLSYWTENTSGVYTFGCEDDTWPGGTSGASFTSCTRTLSPGTCNFSFIGTVSNTGTLKEAKIGKYYGDWTYGIGHEWKVRIYAIQENINQSVTAGDSFSINWSFVY